MTQPISQYSRSSWPEETPSSSPATRGAAAENDLPDFALPLARLPPFAIQPSAPRVLPMASAQAVQGAAPSNGPGPNLVFDATRDAYVLSGSARGALQPLFDVFGFDASRVSVAFVAPWRVGWRNAAYTLGNSVTVNRDRWNQASPTSQLRLLAHELTHSVQYARLGYAHFLARYAIQYFQNDNYDVPSALAAIPVRSLDPVDPRFTLDQIAQRVGMACVEGQ